MPACCTCASVTTKAVFRLAWTDYQLFLSRDGEKREKEKRKRKRMVNSGSALYVGSVFCVELVTPFMWRFYGPHLSFYRGYEIC